MVWKQLQAEFNTNIAYHNTAVGGWNTLRGVEHYEERALLQPYDMLVLGFGMNDGGFTSEDYEARLEEMVLRFHAKNPDAPIVLLATMLPNIHSNWLCNQPNHEQRVLNLEKKYPFVTAVNMTELHRELLQRKRYRDMTGNNVNHPNDFLGRIYAQAILKTILG